jgi:hypothetical protein
MSIEHPSFLLPVASDNLTTTIVSGDRYNLGANKSTRFKDDNLTWGQGQGYRAFE